MYKRQGHITHGLANAMYLPYVIAYNAKADGVAERYADIARTMGVDVYKRQALDTWLIARHSGGTFILRIEDTDQGRLVEGATQLYQKL